MKNFLKTLPILFLAQLLMTGKILGQAPPPASAPVKSTPAVTHKDTSVVFFDFAKISAEDMATIYNALGNISRKNNAGSTYQVRANDDVYHIIKNKLNYTDEVKHHITQAIKNMVVSTNAINKNLTIRTGQTVVIPKLPVKPASDGSSRYTQFIDVYANKSYLSSTVSAASFSPSNLPGAVDFDQAKLFAYKLKKEDLKTFIRLISDATYRRLYGTGLVTIDTPAFIQVNYLGLSGTTLSKSLPSVPPDSSVVKLVKAVGKNYYHKYFVLDYFNGQSLHGKKVMDVIKSKFAQFGLDTNGYNIVPVPINYFQNADASLNFIKNYYGITPAILNNPSVAALPGVSLYKFLKNFKDRQYKACEDCIPEGFLNAVFKYYYDLKPDIISSSFYANTENDIAPRYTTTSTNLVTAVLNDPGNIESLIAISQDPKVHIKSKQPLLSYFTNYPTVGCIIVGDRLTGSKFSGWYSVNGNRVTTLGEGMGWGDNTTTIKPADAGASFATPDVAAQLYIAKAFWCYKGLQPDANESRIRLLLATDLDSAFVGKFASAGMINMQKLLQTSQGYVEMINGEIEPISFQAGSISFDGETRRLQRNGKTAVTLKDGTVKQVDVEGICGLTVINHRYYAFSEQDLCWKPIDLEDMHINLVLAAKAYPINNISDFSTRFKQIVLLNNH